VLNQCLYGFISSNEDAPAAAGYTSVKLTREELEVTEGIGIRKNTDYTTLEEAKNEYESGSFALVDVRDYKQVRFPGLASTLYGAAFIDDTGKIVSRVSVSNANGFINGMFPQGLLSWPLLSLIRRPSISFYSQRRKVWKRSSRTG